MEPLIDSAAAAVWLGVGERQIRNLVYKRQIPYVKIGRLVRFKVSDLDVWITQQTVGPGPPPRQLGRLHRIP
jgi:excisionase family DNA binding protein